MIWIGFLLLVIVLIALDLGLFHKKDTAISIKNALFWTVFWVALSLAFNVVVYFLYQYNPGHILGSQLPPNTGASAALTFFTGYIIEKSLSLDNVFVFALVFGYFKIEQRYQHRVLFWGIVGAVVFRALLIISGVYIIEKFQIITVLLGVFILFTAAKMMLDRQDTFRPESNILIRFLHRRNLVDTSAHEGKFFKRVNGRKMVTTLFLTMVLIEFSDIAFAVDSIPAIFAVTSDPFIILTSNIFAIFGLRSLYFVLAASLTQLRFLKQSLIFILIFIGVKMGISQLFHIPTLITLMFIIGTLATGIIASLLTSPDPESDVPKTELNLSEPPQAQSWKWGRSLFIITILVIMSLIGIIFFKSSHLTAPFGWLQ